MNAEWRIRTALFGTPVLIGLTLIYLPALASIPATIALGITAAYAVARSP